MSGAPVPGGAITCQPGSRVQTRHWTASSASSSAMAGVLLWAAGGWVCAACAPSGQPRSRLIVAQARTNSFGQFLDVIGFLERRHGENVAIVLFQIDLQLFGEFRQIGGIFDILLVLGLEDFFFLRLAVGQDDVFLLGAATPASPAAALLLLRVPTAPRQENKGHGAAPNPECHVKTWCYHTGNAPRDARARFGAEL